MVAINSALSGLVAAQKRLAVSADNTANAQTTAKKVDGKLANVPFQPNEVINSTQLPAGVQAIVRPAEPATVPLYDPASSIADENGVVQTPNVSLENEAVTRIQAESAYKANLKVMETVDDMESALLDIEE